MEYVDLDLSNADGKLIQGDLIASTFHRAIIFGGPGSGKTTLLRYIEHSEATQLLSDRPDYSCPIFLRAFDLCQTNRKLDLVNVLNEYISTNQITLDDNELVTLLNSGRFTLLVDGLDEVRDEHGRKDIVRSLQDFVDHFPKNRAFISSRVGGFKDSIAGFELLTLNPFGEKSIRTFVNRAFGSNRKDAQLFLSEIFSIQPLLQLAENPLWLHWLVQVFGVHGRLPNKPAVLFSDFTDLMLSTWESNKAIGTRSSLTLQMKHRFLEEIAIYLFEKGESVVSTDKLQSIISGVIDELYLGGINSKAGINEIFYNAVFLNQYQDRLSFVHKSFEEYYVARAAITTPSRVLTLLQKRYSPEILSFMCDLIDDVSQIVEVALSKGQVLLAARFVANGKRTNRNLIDEVVRRLRNELGESVISLVSKAKPVEDKPTALDSIYYDLTRRWRSFCDSSLPPHVKGERFEDFASDFFNQVFRVVSRDLDTENGELDLILELRKPDPFWVEFGGDALVECKNWATNVPLKDVATFVYKLNQSRCKLGFFVSLSGFTEDAMRTIRNNASNVAAPLLVPIDGSSIEKALSMQQNFEKFFKDRIRDIKYLRKF